MKRHEPAAFLAALLNSQPMGFYSRSALVQDARRHGVEVRPVDVCISTWDAKLESSIDGMQPAVRLGLNNIKGLEQEAAWRIEEARSIQPFENTSDLAARANLNAGHLNALASANALESLSGNRRQALWQAVASVPEKGLLRAATVVEDFVEMDAPTEAENTVADYRHLGLTLGRHPLSFLRERLTKMRFIPSDVLASFSNGQLARGCGIVTVRQRPETAKGVVFITIEDEAGTVNVICWSSVVEQQRREVMGAQLLGVYGIWQSENNVRHLVAKRLVDLSHLLGELDTRSRDFHKQSSSREGATITRPASRAKLMCVNYITVSRQVSFDFFRTPMEVSDEWRDEIYQDYAAPFIVHDSRGNRQGLVGSYGFVPKRRMPPGQRLTTMNARAETVGELRTYKKAWATSQLCLIPAIAVFEPNWEQPQHVRWSIGMADRSPFAVAGIWRSWDEDDGTQSHSFTQLTVNADEHPLMRRFHKAGDEKRSVVIIRPEEYDDWLGCKDPERARSFLQLYPADLMCSEPAPKAPASKAKSTSAATSTAPDIKAPFTPPAQEELF